MPNLEKLVKRIENDNPTITFIKSKIFSWNYNNLTITYDLNGDKSNLLHELAHAHLGHKNYPNNIELIKMELNAWKYAQLNLCSKYNCIITNNYIEESLDSYREWLHSISTCPNCGSIGIETKNSRYYCIQCLAKWKLNNLFKENIIKKYKIG